MYTSVYALHFKDCTSGLELYSNCKELTLQVWWNACLEPYISHVPHTFPVDSMIRLHKRVLLSIVLPINYVYLDLLILICIFYPAALN